MNRIIDDLSIETMTVQPWMFKRLDFAPPNPQPSGD